ncbi:MAG: phosphatase PAP2 family protein [Solirubrobacterales bacterium]|nr:phosphatase PAP2 family protein [Solirubrobacterales bacterium]
MSLTSLDRRLLLVARTHGHTPLADRIVSAFSLSGEHAAWWLALGVGGAAHAGPGDRRARWLRGAGAVAIAYAANTTLKLLVQRPRPVLDDLPPLTPTFSGLSFPSAHATTSFAAARAYRGLVPAGALYGLAAGYALSRPYLGVHYPSDVCAGAALGTVVGGLAWR